jgi:hypothetical protein
MADQNVIEAQSPVIEAEIVNVKRSTPFYRKPKFIALVILLALLIGFILWLVHVFSVYRKASVYKNAYDITQQQFEYCDKIANEKEEKKNFDYCDELKSRFKSIERETK